MLRTSGAFPHHADTRSKMEMFSQALLHLSLLSPQAMSSAITEVLERKPCNIAVNRNPQHDLHLVEFDIPEPGPKECLVQVPATGICGSDVHFWKRGKIGDMVVVGENNMGHGSAGVVVKARSEATRFKPGRPLKRISVVALTPIDRRSHCPRVRRSCSLPICYFYRTGRYNACPDVKFLSPPTLDGTLRIYHVHPEAWLHALPDNPPYEEGCLLESLSFALTGAERSSLRLSTSLAICGAGPIGPIALLAAHAASAAPAIIADLDKNRLEEPKKLVPLVRTLRVNKADDTKTLGQRIVDKLGKETELALECSGVESNIQAGMYVSRLSIIDRAPLVQAAGSEIR